MHDEKERRRVFSAAGKKIEVYPAAIPGSPVLYLNTFSGEGGQVCQRLRQTDGPDFSLVAVGGLVWDHDMAPWDIPPIAEGDTPCTGGADDHLRLLCEDIVPMAEEGLLGRPAWRGLAGYSLAGLFALYAAYQTDLFSRLASISGSLWFPGFRDYAFSHEWKGRVERLYFSLGDREHQTKNPYLKTVKENTEALEAFYRQRGLRTTLCMNPGNHYKNAVARTAAGLAWLLGQ